MYSKNIVLLAAAGLVADVLAVNVHRHGHGQVHQKKDLVFETEVATVTEWVTVTWDPHAATSTAIVNKEFAAPSSRTRKYSQKSSSSIATVAPTPSSVEVPTTLATQTKPAETEAKPSTTPVDTPAAVPATTEAAPVPTPTTVAAAPPASSSAASSPAVGAPASSGGNKRMLAYNDPNLLSGFVGSNSKVGIKYNWGQVDDSTSQAKVPFAPMLWSPAHASGWDANAEKAIANGAPGLLSFNECDNAGQCNMSPAAAAAAHIQYMNKYKGRVPISTPSITNSNIPGEGIDWLKAFLQACDGQCAFDFVACHWYNNEDNLLDHLKAVSQAAGGAKVWLTEFATVGGLDAEPFLKKVTAALDTPEFDFVEHYAWFMVSEGSLVSGGQPNALGNVFAYNSGN